jgi:hypothetical protein
MKSLGCLLHQNEIIVDTTTLDKCTLIRRDYVGQFGSQPVCQELGDNFCKNVDKTNRTEVFDLVGL